MMFQGAASAGRYRVILADDNDDVRSSFAEMLAADYDVIASVPDGKQLVEAAATLRPDLLVVDVSMPVMNGIEAVRRLKTQGYDGPIVMMSMNSDPAYVRRAFQLGASGFVWKASGAADLPLSLQTVLDGGKYVSPGLEA